MARKALASGLIGLIAAALTVLPGIAQAQTGEDFFLKSRTLTMYVGSGAVGVRSIAEAAAVSARHAGAWRLGGDTIPPP
jgi:hypothetical protein